MRAESKLIKTKSWLIEISSALRVRVQTALKNLANKGRKSMRRSCIVISTQ
jgi:hypothetical protein